MTRPVRKERLALAALVLLVSGISGLAAQETHAVEEQLGKVHLLRREPVQKPESVLRQLPRPRLGLDGTRLDAINAGRRRLRGLDPWISLVIANHRARPMRR